MNIFGSDPYTFEMSCSRHDSNNVPGALKMMVIYVCPDAMDLLQRGCLKPVFKPGGKSC